jgi:hypothetical protein
MARPIGAGVLTIIGGLFILIGGLAFALVGALLFAFLGVWSKFFLLGLAALWRGARVLAGACCLFGFIFAGSLTALAHEPGPPPEVDAEAREIVGVLMIAVPRGHTVWGALAIIFALVSWAVALGGLFIGFLLTLIGGILALVWKPLPGGVITVEARSVPPPPG